MLKLLHWRLLWAVPASMLLFSPAVARGTQISHAPAHGRVILGKRVLEPQHDRLAAGRSEAFRLRAHDSGVAGEARIYIDRTSTAKTVIVGVYNGVDGRPGSMLSSGAVSAPQAGSWVAVPLAPNQLTSGRTYWLTILGERGTLRFRDRHRGRCDSEKNAAASLSRLPSRWHRSRMRAHTHCTISAYVLEANAVIPDPKPSPTFASLPSPASPPALTAPAPPAEKSEAPAALIAPENEESPRVSGTATEGHKLTTTNGTWSDNPASFEYQWEDCDGSGENCRTVSGATGSSYVLAEGDVGYRMRSIVTATNEGGSTSAGSAATAAVHASPPPPLPVNTVAPTVSGTTTQGQVLSSTKGTWSGSPTRYAYQWQDCDSSGANCVDIPEATAASYTLLSSDVGSTMRVVVSASNAGGSAHATSAATAIIAEPVTPPPVNTVAPAISGTTTQGKVLSSTKGTWSGSPTGYAVQWQDCNSSGQSCANISGATSSSYTLAESDAGHKLRVVVTATNGGGSTPAKSAVTPAVVLPLSPANMTLPTISGSTVQGQVLSSSTGAWSHSPTSYAYQWQDCNSSGASCTSISGATSSSYTLGAGDVGHTVRLAVTAKNASGSAVANSTQTASVAASSSGGTPYPTCTQTLSTSASVGSTVSGAAGGSVICLSSGAYGKLTLNATPSSDVTVQAAPGAHATATGVDISGSHLVVRGLWISGEVALQEGASFITIDHNDISEAGEGIVFNTSDCKAPNAPSWAGCEPDAPITNVIISGNHIHDIGQPGTEDAIHLDYWRNVTITGNEFDHIIESGNHTDCMQSVYGGSELSFDHNYEHDNDCQGFFVKDGDVSNVSFSENLFLRDNEPDGKGEHFFNLAQFWNAQDLTIDHNTIWDGKGIVLVAEDAQNSPTASIDHNLFSYLSVSKPAGTPYAITEGNDIFGESPQNLSTDSTDSINSKPQFDDTASDDYRLASNPKGIGIDWSPAEERYGPIS